MKDLIQRFIREEEGQDLVEYALLVVFLALVLIAILSSSGTSVNTLYSGVNSGVNAS